MGLRSWLTLVNDEKERSLLIQSINSNPIAYGAIYEIQLAERIDEASMEAGIWIAWSGDCSSSLTENMPEQFHDQTRLLDNILDVEPGFRIPSDYGEVTPLYINGGIEKFDAEVFLGKELCGFEIGINVSPYAETILPDDETDDIAHGLIQQCFVHGQSGTFYYNLKTKELGAIVTINLDRQFAKVLFGSDAECMTILEKIADGMEQDGLNGLAEELRKGLKGI